MDNVILGTFVTCVVGGILPWVNTEIAVSGAALLVAPGEMSLLVTAAAAGQTLAKTSLYTLARWAPDRLPAKARDLLSRGRPLNGRRRTLFLVLLTSSTVGLPPFFLTTLAAGMIRVPLAVFVCSGLAGSALRYGVLAWGVGLVTGWLDLLLF